VFALPGIAAAQLTLVEPDFDIGGAQAQLRCALFHARNSRGIAFTTCLADREVPAQVSCFQIMLRETGAKPGLTRFPPWY
jgi:hypothetical protein